MYMVNVLDGQVTELDGDFLNRDFEAENVTPFPMRAVLTQLYMAEVLSDDVARDAGAMELAVLFQQTFGESISIKRVKQAQRAADERIDNDDYDCARQTVVMQELVAAYGRQYAFNASSFRRQYDAVKWYSTLGMYHFGEWLLDATERAGDAIERHGKAAKRRLTAYVRDRVPLLDNNPAPESGDTQVFEPDDEQRANAD